MNSIDLHYNNLGLIGLLASAVDSTIESNKLFNTAGIFVHTGYRPDYTASSSSQCLPGDTVLTNNISLAHLSGSQAFYCLDVPPGATQITQVTFTITDPTGEGDQVDLYVQEGSHPAPTMHKCALHLPGPTHTCTILLAKGHLQQAYYAMLVGSYTGVTLTSSYPLYSNEQLNQYFVEVRGNTIEGSFGFHGKPRPENKFGSGVVLNTQVGTLGGDNSVKQLTRDSMGFGVSIARNTLHHAALANVSGGSGGGSRPAAVAVSTGGSWDSESQTPGYVDTLIFGNTISAVSSAVPPPATGNPQAFGILNGEGSPNYPQGTVVCHNHVTEVTQACWDVPPPGPQGQPCTTPIVCP
jgi:hypothetical protein